MANFGQLDLQEGGGDTNPQPGQKKETKEEKNRFDGKDPCQKREQKSEEKGKDVNESRYNVHLH